ncbi:uncharacterized protein LOC131311400 [Rhododendron vialii]|uniref:uncharacterized protein LOC131311400 n=1 Tax=Rhododendron vialii TaxID=182163 RepID=UPI00265F3D96|nr:uncharacterized protein LOC131311400 [Rhododendron vialii]
MDSSLIKKPMDSSEPTAEESFRARVQKAFGPLSSSQSPWSLTDDEIEKREWNRSGGGTRDDDVTPCSSSFDGISFSNKDRKKRNSRRLRRDLENDGVEDQNDDEDGGEGDGGDGGDEWEIRSAIGLDRTLDNEEEEDEYDIVAAGRENASDVLYMRDVTDHGPYLNSYNIIPSSVPDSHANHLAAKIRLKEGGVEANKIDPHYSCDKSTPDVQEPSIKASGDGGKPKSILKRKNDEATTKEQKRVKFDPGCKEDFEAASENPKDLLTATTISDDKSSLRRNTFGVPDYLLNPSKYTRYSFDSASEVDVESSSRVCMDFLKLAEMAKPEESASLLGTASSGLPKSVTFIPRKKAMDATPRDCSNEAKKNQENGSEQLLIQKGCPLGVAADDTDDTESGDVRDMEDELESSAASSSTRVKKQCRNYRSRSNLDDTVT